MEERRAEEKRSMRMVVSCWLSPPPDYKLHENRNQVHFVHIVYLGPGNKYSINTC